MGLSFFEKQYNYFLIRNKDKRKYIKKVRKVLHSLRGLRIPIYKNIYDSINFHSYYVVLERIFNKNKDKVYFEWGPGPNTELAKTKMRKVYTVEHNRYWFEKYKDSNDSLIYSPILEDGCADYPNEIKKISETVDVAFVDGRCRTECIKSCSEVNVPIVVMHDSLDPFKYEYANDTTPPIGHDDIYFVEGYSNYKYFIEVDDLRTIVLVNSIDNFENIQKDLSDYHIRYGETIRYKELTS